MSLPFRTTIFPFIERACTHSLSLTISGSGYGSIEIGNCENTGGEVAVYLRGERIAALTRAQQLEISSDTSVGLVVSFYHNDGDVLQIRDEGENSVFAMKNLVTNCVHGNNM